MILFSLGENHQLTLLKKFSKQEIRKQQVIVVDVNAFGTFTHRNNPILIVNL